MNKSIQYSICATIHNYGDTIERSLRSNVERAANDQMEFVACDSKSSNATLQEMSNYSMLFNVVKILSIKCSRKKGRQFAFENTTGDYARAKAEICESELGRSKKDDQEGGQNVRYFWHFERPVLGKILRENQWNTGFWHLASKQKQLFARQRKAALTVGSKK